MCGIWLSGNVESGVEESHGLETGRADPSISLEVGCSANKGGKTKLGHSILDHG